MFAENTKYGKGEGGPTNINRLILPALKRNFDPLLSFLE
jgi:hypothetical protein